jgi:hypothetical protein
MPEIPAAVPLQEQRRSPALGVTSPPLHAGFSHDLARRNRDMPNGKKASRSRDRIPRDSDCSAMRSGAGTGRRDVLGLSSAALVLRHGQSGRCLLALVAPVSPCAANPSSRPAQDPPSPASPQLKTLMAQPVWSRTLEPSIYHSRADPLDCRDGGHSSGPRRIGRDTSMSAAQLVTVALSQSSRQCDSGSLPLAFPPCGITWPIQEMPHGDVAGFYLAPPRITWQPWSAAG